MYTTIITQPTLALAWQLADAEATTRLQLPSSFTVALATVASQTLTVKVTEI